MKKFSGTTLVMLLLLVISSCSKSSTEELEQLYTETNLGNEKVTIDPVQMEEDLVLLINQHRNSLGLNTLANSAPAYKYAKEHTGYMIAHNILSHDNFDSRATQVAEETNAISVSENVARYYISAEKTLEAWVESDSHREAMEGDFTHTTLSIQLDKDGRPYFTQIFIKVP